MSDLSRFLRLVPLSAALLVLAAPASAQRVSAKDRVAIDALDQRMAAAEKRYRDALLLVANGDPKGTAEGDAALEDMEDVIDACAKQRGCELNTQLAAFKRLLKSNVDAQSPDEDEEGSDEPL
ncbi:MAG TPA: lytic transglycosylase, partial [Pseudoxanthomonas sp.]|nr:lytic transglycosylase [Pseudoxanthomonas sp.]